MPRVTDSATITALSSDSLNLASLITFHFDTPTYITDFGQSITYGNTYSPSSHVLEVGGSTETGGIKVNSMTIRLSSVEQTFLSKFLNENLINTKVTIQRAILDANDAVIGQPIDYFTGRIVSFDVEDSDTSEIAVEIASHWQDFEKIQNRKTNTKSQQFWFPQDKGFSFAASTITNLKWGRK